MINYSIVLRRTDISDENSPKKAYPTAQYTDVMDLDHFCKHIADHGCAYDRADISAMVIKTVDCLREQLLAGQKVKLGDLGSFSVSLQSKGAESAEKFTAQNISGVKVNWEPGKEFLDLLDDADFQQVPTRIAVAATLKAEKAGDDVVDIAQAKENARRGGASDGDDDGDDTGGNNPGSGSGSGSGDNNPGGGTGGGGNDDLPMGS